MVLRRLASGESRTKIHGEVDWHSLLNIDFDAAVGLVTALGQ